MDIAFRVTATGAVLVMVGPAAPAAVIRAEDIEKVRERLSKVSLPRRPLWKRIGAVRAALGLTVHGPPAPKSAKAGKEKQLTINPQS